MNVLLVKNRCSHKEAAAKNIRDVNLVSTRALVETGDFGTLNTLLSRTAVWQ